jgi:uncharacterized damage-inducible protein DinB
MPSIVYPEIALLLQALDNGYDQDAWHGPNLRASAQRVRPDEAAWRPAEGQRNIWEITVHAAYWKYAAWRRLVNEKRGSFPYSGSDWFPRPVEGQSAATVAAAWKEDLALLETMHQKLRAAVAAFTPDDLRQTDDGRLNRAALITGIALHDVYHAGQIQVLKRLYKNRVL